MDMPTIGRHNTIMPQGAAVMGMTVRDQNRAHLPPLERCCDPRAERRLMVPARRPSRRDHHLHAFGMDLIAPAMTIAALLTETRARLEETDRRSVDRRGLLLAESGSPPATAQ